MAFAAGCRRFWVLTTDDTVDALRFYNAGADRCPVRAVDQHAAPLKPQIPVIGNYGIPHQG